MFESWELCLILCSTEKKVMVSITLFQESQLIVFICKKCCWVAGKQEGEDTKKEGLQTKPACTQYDEPRHEVKGKL